MKKDLLFIVCGASAILIFALLTTLAKDEQYLERPEKNGSWACAADTFLCPDGSSVKRVPPYCHFAACQSNSF